MKNAIVTGATSGIGYETALGLAKKGFKVGIIGRNFQKLEQARKNIIKASNNFEIYCFKAELSNQQEIINCAKEIKKEFSEIHVLINNAGAVFGKRQLSVDRIEMQWAVNHLAYFLLTNELLETLIHNDEARIVNVSSNMHLRGEIYFEDVSLEKKYNPLKAYAQSKLANVMFTYELAEKLKNTNITVNALHPGMVKTKIGTKNTNKFQGLVWTIFSSFTNVSPKKGAKTSLFVATSSALNKITGKYWAHCKEKEPHPIAFDKTARQRLWKLSQSFVTK